MEEKIIRTTIDLIEKYSVKFTLDDIAANAKISKKTIYKYFDCKESLLKAVIDYIFNDIHLQHKEILKSNVSNIEKLRQIVCVYPQVIHFSGIKLDKLIELYPNIYKQITQQLNDNWDLTLSLYDECVKQESIKNIDRKYFRLILLGIFDQSLHTEDHENTTKDCIDAVFTGFLKQ